MKIWVCIPVHDRLQHTVRVLECLRRQDYENFSVIVCDDGSTDGTSDEIRRRFTDVVVLNGDGNLWWTGATNQCVRYAIEHASDESDCVITLNNDLEIRPDFITIMVRAATKYPNSIITSAGYSLETGEIFFPGAMKSWLTARTRIVDPVTDHLPNDTTAAHVTDGTGRGTLIPSSVFKHIGLFDERHLPHYGADYDFTYRARRKGYAVLVCFDSRVFMPTEQRGMTSIGKTFSVFGLYDYLTNMKSPANLQVRWWLALNNCPRLLLPTYFALDIFFVIGAYFRYHLKRLLHRFSWAT